MALAAQLKRGISRQFSIGSLRNGIFSFKRQNSLDPRCKNLRFSFGRQSSLDPIRRNPGEDDLTVPENLDSTMQLLFLACQGDVEGVQDLLDDGVDVNSIDLDGRTALHIAACEGHVDVVKVLLINRANIDAHDRWGSTAAADAKHYGHVEVYNILKALGAKAQKTRKTPMSVANPREVPEYELNPLELQVRKSDGISKGSYQVAKWNGTKVSVKILDKDSYSDPESINSFKNELTLLEKVRHPNVVQFVGAVTQNIPMMIIAEFPTKGDLKTYLQKKGRLSLSKALRFALDIARGMNYLHECKPDPVIHCDLKPKNILLDSGGQLKVAGFGVLRMSTISPDKVKLLSPEAIDRSSLYVAPEIYKGVIFEKRVDVYSFALLVYEMMEGVQPFQPKSPEDAARLMCVEGKRPIFKQKSKSYPPDLKELIEECWNPLYNIRPTFSEVIIRLDKIILNGCKQGWWAWMAVKKVWASKWNERAYFSTRKVKLDHNFLCMAVLVQEIINADYAFVIHTTNPSSGDSSEIYAEVVKGLGETLVGAYPGRALSFVCKKSNPNSPQVLGYPSKPIGLFIRRSIIFRSDSNGEDLEGYAGAGLYDSVPMDEEDKVVLDYSSDPLIIDGNFRQSILSSIARAGSAIEELYGSPQDIEGVVKEGKIYVVQTRPQM